MAINEARSTTPSFGTPYPCRRAFFVTYGASHVAKTAPVVKALQREGVECIVMALTTGYGRAAALGLNPLGYKDFLHLMPDTNAVFETGQMLAEGNTHPDVGSHETLCYLGVNFMELKNTLGHDAANSEYRKKGRQVFMPVAFMQKVIASLHPGVVVTTSTPRTEEAAIRAASLLGVHTLTMVDLFAPPSDPFLARPIHATRITVVSEQVRQRFIEFGLEPAQVVTTGSPDFDALYDPAAKTSGVEFRQELGWESLHIVMWAGILEPSPQATGAPNPANEREDGLAEGRINNLAELCISVENRLRNWVRQRSDVALIVRYHPSQYHHLPIQEPQNRVYVSNSGAEPINRLVQACNTVIHQISTVGFEAALLHKRVIHLAFSKWMSRLDFDLSSLGPSEPAHNLDELIQLLNHPTELARSAKMIVPDGPAGPRVATEILKLLHREK